MVCQNLAVKKIEELRIRLAKIHISLKSDITKVDDILREVLDVGRLVGLTPEKRAEGYALTVSHQAAVVGLPHLRIAKARDLVTVWIRAPYALDESRCEAVGIDAEELYQKLLAGARKIGEIFRKHSGESEFLQISLP